MRIETIKRGSIASQVSKEMADIFKDKITKEQYEVLKHNVYTIENGDAVFDKYAGDGGAWIEIDKDGQIVDLQYIHDDVAVVVGYDWEEDEFGVIWVEDEETQIKYLTTGMPTQSVTELDFRTEQLKPLILENGNVRVLVNCSCKQLIRF